MTQINFPFPVNELAAALIEQLLPHLNGFKPQAPPPAVKYLTRKETAEQLNVSLPTLHQYTKRNLITGVRFGVRVMYKTTDIEALYIPDHVDPPFLTMETHPNNDLN